MRNILLLLISAISFQSCNITDNENGSDDKFVGVWKFHSFEPKKPEFNDLIDSSQLLSTISKVPNTNEEYTFTFTGLMYVLTQKGQNTLVGNLNLAGRKDFIVLTYKEDRLYVTENSKSTIEFTKIK